MKKNVWNTKFTTAVLVLIPVAVGINYVGKVFAEALKLPLWLDAIGTVIAGALAGPIVGGIAGWLKGIIHAITVYPPSFFYGMVGASVGIVIGVMARKGWFNTLKNAVITGLIASLVAAIISTPLNIWLFEGQSGNVWGDTVFAYLMSKNVPLTISAFLGELATDLPDKTLVTVIGFLIFKALPIKFTTLFGGKGSEAVEYLD